MSRPSGNSLGSNERTVFERLRRGPASRAELAKATGLSAPTVGKAADALVEAGLLEEFRATRDDAPSAAGHPNIAGVATLEVKPEPSMGRPARPLRLNRTNARLVALQLGVHRTRVAAMPVSGLSG